MVDRNGIQIIDKKTKYDPESIEKKDFSTTKNPPRSYRVKKKHKQEKQI